MWKFIGSCTGDDFMIEGINIFEKDWTNTGEEVEVRDPHYQQKFIFSVWKITERNKEVKFAAGEFSNNVFGIYVNEAE